MFRKAGVDAPSGRFVWIRVNGTDHELYLAVEDINDGFLERSGRTGGVLCKSDSDMFNHGGERMSRMYPDRSLW